MGSLQTIRDIQIGIGAFFTQTYRHKDGYMWVFCTQIETYRWIYVGSLHTDKDKKMDIGGFFTDY